MKGRVDAEVASLTSSGWMMYDSSQLERRRQKFTLWHEFRPSCLQRASVENRDEGVFSYELGDGCGFKRTVAFCSGANVSVEGTQSEDL